VAGMDGHNQSFNPRPPFQTGATSSAASVSKGPDRFNPRPPFQTGATPAPIARQRQMWRFNPRPPFQTGATDSWDVCLCAVLVSILARLFRRALLQITR